MKSNSSSRYLRLVEASPTDLDRIMDMERQGMTIGYRQHWHMSQHMLK